MSYYLLFPRVKYNLIRQKLSQIIIIISESAILLGFSGVFWFDGEFCLLFPRGLYKNELLPRGKYKFIVI
jgi:hypothetical protein